MARQLREVDASIASGGTISDAIEITNGVPVAIHLQSAWTAANITFDATAAAVASGATFDALKTTAAVEVGGASAGVWPTTGGVFVVLDPKQFLGVRHLKVRSGVAATPVTQAAARTIKVILGREPVE